MDIVNVEITELVDNVLVSISPQVETVSVTVNSNIDNVSLGVQHVTDTVDIAATSQIDTVLIEITEGTGTGGNYEIGNDWMALVRGYKILPVFNSSIVSGDVYTYVYETAGPDLTYYRYIATDLSIDGFYSMFDGSSVTDLIAEKKIVL
jgi:hypothetical protein